MNVGIVIEQFDPSRGGVEQWTRQFVEHLGRRGHQVHLLARSVATSALDEHVAYHTVDAPRGRLDFAFAAEKLADSLPLDVVHDTGAGWRADVFQPHGGSRRASVRQNLLLAPPLLRPLKRATAPWTGRYREFERLLARQYVHDGRIFLAISEMVRRDFIELHGVPESHIRRVYNGVDLDRFAPHQNDEFRDRIRADLKIEPDEILFLIVAHNWALKGVPTLLAAHELLVAAGNTCHVVVVGGKRRPSHAAPGHREKRRLTHFVGPVDDAAPYYAAADAYVHPTFYDPCSLVALEALASGLPTITSRYNGAGELLTPGVEGHVIQDPADASALADVMRDLFDDHRRTQMGRAARRLAEKNSSQQSFDQIVDIYAEIVDARSNPQTSLRRAG